VTTPRLLLATAALGGALLGHVTALQERRRQAGQQADRSLARGVIALSTGEGLEPQRFGSGRVSTVVRIDGWVASPTHESAGLLVVTFDRSVRVLRRVLLQPDQAGLGQLEGLLIDPRVRGAVLVGHRRLAEEGAGVARLSAFLRPLGATGPPSPIASWACLVERRDSSWICVSERASTQRAITLAVYVDPPGGRSGSP
jgi:hypothetical protein